MKKDRINSLLRNFVKTELSPTQDDIIFVSKIYQSFNELLGTNNCIQIGSYPRYTAVKPMHDLDILYIIGDWNSANIIPKQLLTELAERFEKEYKNPTSYKLNIEVQTHSISFKYMQNENEIFAVDLVPALKSGINEFGKSMFYVPEIIKFHRGNKRADYYKNAIETHKSIDWIKTDPIGYIEVAANINQQNEDFRKCVKFVKGWKNAAKSKNENFKLKSFHLEQLITRDYKINSSLEIFDSIFKFFTSLKKDIESPNIRDRADGTKYIDNYIEDITSSERELIHQAIDAILIAFEEINEQTNIKDIIQSGFYIRKSSMENFLFDQKIPILIDSDYTLLIDGFVEKLDGFRKYHANLKNAGGVVDTKNSIDFKVVTNNTNSQVLKWKVKNDNTCSEPRGEINDNKTSNNPEKTAFIGKHYVDCFAIKNNVCVARDRVNVIVRQ